MKNEIFCQSCGMPLDNADLLGTEKDGLKSREYCNYCYKDGAFVNPEMTLKEMTDLVITQMEKMKIPSPKIDFAVTALPYLKRWAKKGMPA